MKRLLLAVFCAAFLCGCPNAPTPTPPPPAVPVYTATWTYSAMAPCSDSVSSNCLSGFTWGYFLGSDAPVPLALVKADGSASYESTVPDTVPSGSSFYVVANYINISGVAQLSDAAVTDLKVALRKNASPAKKTGRIR